MGLFDRMGRVVRANLNDLVSKAEDPEKILEQAVQDMQENLVQLRQAVARSIAEQKRTEQQYFKNQEQADTWHKRAQLALTKGDENLAREALRRKKSFADVATTLKTQLGQQNGQVDTLRQNLIALESKISEAKTKKNMLKARAKAAEANQQLQSTLSGIDTSSAMGAFERMEEKVLEMEAVSEAAGELGGVGIESQFAELEASSVDDDLLAMKMELAGANPAQEALPPVQDSASQSPEMDAELEALRSQMKDL